MEFISNEHIEFYTGEKYENIPYGTIYIVPGKYCGNGLTQYRKEVKAILEYLKRDRYNWIESNLVFLDVDNDLFEAKYNPTLYSAVIPTQENIDQGTCFYVSSITDPGVEYHFNEALLEYNRRLIDILDEILDTYEFPDYFFIPPKPVENNSGPRMEFMIGGGNGPKREVLLLDKLSRLEITPTTYDILLPDYNKQFKFTAQVKALYVLFLLHPEGIRMKEWYKYKDKFSQLYFLFTNRSDVEKIRKSINKLFDMYSTNALEVKKSQCNREVCYVIRDKDLQKYYVIEPSWARPHRIRLDRKLVTIPDNLL